MKRLYLAVTVLVLLTCLLGISQASTIFWTLPTQYTDNTAISVADRNLIRVNVYRGTASTGPWTSLGTSNAGATSFVFPSPAMGSTTWYTIESVLNGMTSAKSPSVSFTKPYLPTKSPSNITVTDP